jgi:Ca2+-transporting ATPase
MTTSAAPWHAASASDALTRLSSRATGLTEEEAALRLECFGPNRARPSRPVSASRILLDQLKSVVVALLLAATALSLLLGDWIDAAAIAAVLVVNTAIGFTTELRARRAMEGLLGLEVARAAVVRNGRPRSVAAADLVPGDVIELDAGQQVPADARLLQSTDLRTSEAPLTGESLPVAKSAEGFLPVDTVLAERACMIYRGTTVAAGTGRAIVTETGDATELGRIGLLVAGMGEERTPLERRLDALGRRLVWLALALAAVVAALGAMQGAALRTVLGTGLALAVAAVPEALPAVATIALAVGLRRMAHRRALVRRLPAVEALGSTTVVCTDKTRTLTSGEMSVVRVWTEEDEEARRRWVLEVAALASRPGRLADPVDGAVLQAAAAAGIDRDALERRWPLLALVPFSSTRKRVAAFHRVEGRVVAAVKGAPETVLGLCALDAASSDRLRAINDRLAADGLRVLAVAGGPVDAPGEPNLASLTFLGLLGLMDPPGPGVKETIGRLRRAGIRTVLLTGDQRRTAEAVGRQVGALGPGETVLDGGELQGVSEEELSALVARAGGFSRVSPEDKLRVVRALQRRGEVVAMLGDGVNDAAALKAADVGVAMGIRGTDVAKEAAAVVLQDDRLETVAAAVEQGRIVYDDIRKFVFYLFSCNLAELLVLLVAGLAGLPLPLPPLQILWLNLVTDTFPALALAVEPGDPDVMTRPPRSPQEALLSRSFLGSVLLYAVLICGCTTAAFLWGLPGGASRANAMAFMTLGVAQILHLGNARSLDPVLQPARALANPSALLAVAVSIGLQLAAMFFAPLARVLGVEPLGLRSWAIVLGLAAVPAVAGQAWKLLRRRPHPRRNAAQ